MNRREPLGRPVRALFIEDDDDVRDLMVRALARLGLNVVSEACVRGALAALAVQSFDLLIVDLSLPDGSGNDVAARAREIEAGSPVLVALTGRSEPRDPETAPGFHHYMVKPVPIGRLASVIERDFPGSLKALPDTERRRSTSC